MSENRGQIGLIAGPVTKIQWIISATTQSPAFHVVLGLGGGKVISSLPSGVGIEDESAYGDIIWSAFDLTEDQVESITQWALARTGTPYNYVADFIILVESFTPVRFPGFVNRWLSSGRSWMCSQFADAAYAQAGVHIFTDGRPRGFVAPASFVPVFRRYGWWPDQVWNPQNSPSVQSA